MDYAKLRHRFFHLMNFIDYLRSETTLGWDDLKYAPFAILGYAIYRLILSNFFLKPLSLLLAEKLRYKLIHRGFDMIHYIMSTILGTLAFSTRPYFHCPFYFLDCAKHITCTGPTVVCSVLEKIYFFFFASYYLSDVFWIGTTKDIPMLIAHHTVTITMITACALVARPVVGFSIMVLHDWSDIFLYSGKITNYLGWKKFSDLLMVCFAVSFLYLRLFGCLTILITIFTKELDQPHHAKLYFISRCAFGGLYICHCIWGYQILRALKRIFFNSEQIRDTRSDKADSKEKKE